MRTLFVALALSLAVLPAFAQDAEGNPPAAFDAYWMVFLIRGEKPPKLSEAESEALQRRHLQHLGEVWKSGHALVAGPFGGGADDPMRGIVLFRGDIAEAEVRRLAEADPAVQAGRLRVEVRQWYTGAGMLTFQGPPASPPAPATPQR